MNNAPLAQPAIGSVLAAVVDGVVNNLMVLVEEVVGGTEAAVAVVDVDVVALVEVAVAVEVVDDELV